MGTTLAHGIYLPSEGERNCYAGLKVNWETLDQKVADISALQSAIAGALHREIVVSLPTTDIDTATIYMILNGTSATENIYDEYMYISNAWELIGTSATDLTNYYTKGEVDSKLLLKASASDLTSHTGDTTIHVTASDKAKWDTLALIKQLRLVNAQVGSATTIAFSDIDDTNGIKVGDKCMDLDGKMFEITAVDTTNQTVTIGSALVDIALDANVVHTSGAETVGGIKTFSDDTYIKSLNFTNEVPSQSSSSSSLMPIIATITYGDSSPSAQARLNFRITADGSKSLYPHENNQYSLGLASRKWSAVYGTAFYYGSTAVEFSEKFVTTDTVQDIAGNKNFKGLITTVPNGTLWPTTTNTTADITSLGGSSIHIEYKSSGKLTDLSGGAWTVVELGDGCFFFRINNGTDIRFKHFPTNTVNRIPVVSNANRQLNSLTPETDNTYDLGDSTRRWKTVNGVTPSSLSFPDFDNSIDISGYVSVVANANKESLYTPPSNGWICVRLSRTSGALGVLLIQGDLAISGKNIEVESGATTADATIPVIGGVQVSINSALADGVVSAKFIPCLGNV